MDDDAKRALDIFQKLIAIILDSNKSSYELSHTKTRLLEYYNPSPETLKFITSTPQEEFMKNKHLHYINNTDNDREILEKTKKYIQEKQLKLKCTEIDIDYILDFDFLNFFIIDFDSYIEIAKKNIRVEHLINANLRLIYGKILQIKKLNLIDFALDLNHECLSELENLCLKRHNYINEFFIESVKKLLERKWMYDREMIRKKMNSTNINEDQALKLLKEFEENRKNPPKVIL